VIGLLLKALSSYLLGAVIGSLVVGRLRGGVDIRRIGSGNAGSANALRTQGKVFALWVFLIDLGKGWFATGMIAPAHVPFLRPDPDLVPWTAAACALAVVLGHIYPVWYGMRGGKGVATLIGAVLGLNGGLLVPMLLAWVTTLGVTGFVGLASIVMSAVLCLALLVHAPTPRLPLQTFGVVSLLLILFTHRGNLARMWAGREPRTRLLRRRR
jgi:glycerol-3-phosphate acyltransferase PlsY